jgi:SAM-dependent methyltransferase
MHKYRELIRDADRVILPLLESIKIDDLAKHNAGYRRYDVDRQKHFVEREKGRFLKVLDWIECDVRRGTVCDLGCFVPYLPVAMSLLGYQVKIVDKYSLYAETFKEAILRIAEANRIEVFDLDIVAEDLTPLGVNDVVLLMAVVEHLNGTPRALMEAARRCLGDDGALVFEVPNLAAFAKRVRLLFGCSPLPDYATYFASGYPFLGHNREMTVSEVRYLLEHTGFRIERMDCYDYHLQPPETFKGWGLELLKRVTPIRDKYDSILALARPQQTQLPHKRGARSLHQTTTAIHGGTRLSCSSGNAEDHTA